MVLSEEEKGVLLLAARESIREIFGGLGPAQVNYSTYPNLRQRAGAFVTLKEMGELRGCIGYIISQLPLFETVINAAREAATHDPRFFPLEEHEIEKISIEVSVLSVPVPLSSYEEIEIGKHGLLLQEDKQKAVLLPQVAIDHNFNLSQFLTAICEKAWLPGNLWREKFLNLSVFTSIVFSETGNRKKNYVPD